MKIISLETENIKHLKVVNIKPDGSLVVIGGKNAAGKTSVLDSIEYALAGAGSVPAKPIRHGEKKAHVVLDLGDIEVTRTFTSKGTSLKVKNKKGETFASPQAMLDKLVGKLTFDPLEFSRMDAKKQSDVLKQLVGLDFDTIDARQRRIFDKRTDVNRQGKAAKARLVSMIHHDDVPTEEISVHALGEVFRVATERRKKIEDDRRELEEDRIELRNFRDKVSVLESNVRRLEEIMDVVEEVDTEAISLQMGTAESTNQKIRENKDYDRNDKEVQEFCTESHSLTKQMEDIDTKKAKALSKANFPIAGLSITDDGVEFEDIPFDQCSTAQKIRISVAIGLVMNPKLRVLLIREGSLLDEDNLAMIAQMADEADAQIWLERVSRGSECTVILEDGQIMERETSSV